MKRNFAKKAPVALLLMANAIFFTSCSSLWLHRGETVDSVQKGEAAQSAMVPKEQYDELARKYQELITQSKQLTKIEAPAAKTQKPHPPEDCGWGLLLRTGLSSSYRSAGCW